MIATDLMKHEDLVSEVRTLRVLLAGVATALDEPDALPVDLPALVSGAVGELADARGELLALREGRDALRADVRCAADACSAGLEREQARTRNAREKQSRLEQDNRDLEEKLVEAGDSGPRQDHAEEERLRATLDIISARLHCETEDVMERLDAVIRALHGYRERDWAEDRLKSARWDITETADTVRAIFDDDECPF